MNVNPFESVILIDDNPADNFLHRLVVQKSGVASRVREFESAADALRNLQEETAPPRALMLLDINMPNMNGFQFLEQYARLDPEKRSRIKVVMLTTSLSRDDETKARSIPEVADFANKPLTIAKFQDLVSRHGST